jgi:hypothetical protein
MWGDIGIPMGGTIGIEPGASVPTMCFFSRTKCDGSVSSTVVSFRFFRPGQPGR